MRYGIINAMAEEKAALVAAMTDEKQTTIAGKLFHHGKIGNVDVVVVLVRRHTQMHGHLRRRTPILMRPQHPRCVSQPPMRQLIQN